LHGHLVLMSKYSAWASSRLLGAIADSLSDAQFADTPQPCLGGLTVQQELELLYVASGTWYSRLVSEPRDELLVRLCGGGAVAAGGVSPQTAGGPAEGAAAAAVAEPVERAVLVDALTRQCSDWVNLVARMSFNGLNATITYTETPGASEVEGRDDRAETTPQTASTGYTVAHVLTDTTFRRGRLAAALQALGHEVPAVGMREFLPTESKIEIAKEWQGLLDFRQLRRQFSAITTALADEPDTIKLRGPADDVAKCKAFLQEQVKRLAEGCMSEEIAFDRRLHPIAAGPGGGVFGGFLSGKSLAVIECSAAPDDTITVRGLPESIATVVEQVRRRVAELSEAGQAAVFAVPDELRASLEESFDLVAKNVAVFTGAAIHWDGAPVDNDAASRQVNVTGTRGQVDAALALLAKMQSGNLLAPEPSPTTFGSSSVSFYPSGEAAAASPFSESELIIEVHAPEEYHRFLIGARGATMKQIQNESGAQIFFPNTKNAPARVKPSSENVVTIVGHKEACERAQALIVARVKDCASATSSGKDSAYLRLLRSRSPRHHRSSAGHHYTAEVQVQVPSTLHGFVVGGKGFVLKEIQMESGARVFLPTTKTAPARARSAGKDVITIVGSQHACEVARSLILARADDAENGRKAKEDSAYMNLLHELRERGQTASGSKGIDGRKNRVNEMNHMHEMMLMSSQIRPRIQDGEHFYIPTHGPPNAAMLHAMSMQVGESQGQYMEPGVMAHVEQFVHHDGMQGLHPHPRHAVPMEAQHNPWSDPMQQQILNGHPHPHAMSHEQMIAVQAEAAAAQQHPNPPSAPWSGAEAAPPTTWTAPGDELGAAAAWSAAPGHDGFMQDTGMHHHRYSERRGAVTSALCAQIMRDRQVDSDDVSGIVELLNEMPIEGLTKCIEDQSYRHRMVQRCLKHMQQQQQHLSGGAMPPAAPLASAGSSSPAASAQSPGAAQLLSVTSPSKPASPPALSPQPAAVEFPAPAVGSPPAAAVPAE